MLDEWALHRLVARWMRREARPEHSQPRDTTCLNAQLSSRNRSYTYMSVSFILVTERYHFYTKPPNCPQVTCPHTNWEEGGERNEKRGRSRKSDKANTRKRHNKRTLLAFVRFEGVGLFSLPPFALRDTITVAPDRACASGHRGVEVFSPGRKRSHCSSPFLRERNTLNQLHRQNNILVDCHVGAGTELA